MEVFTKRKTFCNYCYYYCIIKLTKVNAFNAYIRLKSTDVWIYDIY